MVTFALILVSAFMPMRSEFVLTETEEYPLPCEKDAWALAIDTRAHGYLLGVHFCLDANHIYKSDEPE